jgi:hypothetical protein
MQPGAGSCRGSLINATDRTNMDGFMKKDMKIFLGLTAFVSGSYFALSLLLRRKKTTIPDNGFSSTAY